MSSIYLKKRGKERRKIGKERKREEKRGGKERKEEEIVMIVFEYFVSGGKGKGEEKWNRDRKR